MNAGNPERVPHGRQQLRYRNYGTRLQDVQGAPPARRPAGILEEGRHDARGIAQEAEILGLVERQPAACICHEKGCYDAHHIMDMQICNSLTNSLPLANQAWSALLPALHGLNNFLLSVYRVNNSATWLYDAFCSSM